jgi:MFS family permease
VGTGVGPILARRFTGSRVGPLRWAIAAGFGLSAAGLVAIVPLSSFGLVLFGSLLRGVGAGMVWVLSSELLYTLTPNAVRGRVFSTDFAAQTLASAISAGVGGYLLDQAGVSIAGMLIGMALLSAVFGLAWALWSLRRARADERATTQH